MIFPTVVQQLTCFSERQIKRGFVSVKLTAIFHAGHFHTLYPKYSFEMDINDFLSPETIKKDTVPWQGGEISAHIYHNAPWICISNIVGSITVQKLRQVFHMEQ